MTDSPVGFTSPEPEQRGPGQSQAQRSRARIRVSILRSLGWVAALLAAGVAGPWPHADASSLFWRVPLALVAMVVAAHASWRRLALSALPVVVIALLVDGVLPGRVPTSAVVASAAQELRRLQVDLGDIAGSDEVRGLLASTGGEAEPEAGFTALAAFHDGLSQRLDSLVLIDERGAAVAWAGARARLPVRLRPLGDRTTTAEPGVGEVWLWLREPILEGGRTVGGLLGGVAVPEGQCRRLLGVSAGSAAVVVARLEGGVPLDAPDGARLLGLTVAPGRAAWWSPPGGAAVVTLIILATLLRGWCMELVLVSAVVWAAIAGLLGRGWWPAVALLVAAWTLSRLDLALRRGEGGVSGDDPESSVPERAWKRPLSWAASVLGALLVGVGAMQLPIILTGLGLQPAPAELLRPGALQVALVAALTLLILALPKPVLKLGWPLRLLIWVPLGYGFLSAEPLALGSGVALVSLLGVPRRGVLLAATAASALLLGSGDAARKSSLVTITEATLARLDDVQAPATALLASLPAQALEDAIRLSPGECLTILGRLASWLDLPEILPGTALMVTAPDGSVAALWEGAAVVGHDGRELAQRSLRGGWRVVVMAPAEPHHLLAALAARKVGVPTAFFDRSGAPAARGAIFRPLSPARVGRALAAGRSWGTVGVGERQHLAYLASLRDGILAVPWVRPPLPEAALVLAGLALWGALPVALWLGRSRWRPAWRARRTFSGRLVVLSAVVALLPLLLLSQLLPRQWTQQQRRMRLELARALSQPMLGGGLERELTWLARDGATAVALYSSGVITWSSRWDLTLAGTVPWMPPPEAYVRAVRGWREPLVSVGERIAVFAPVPAAEAPLVVAIVRVEEVSGAELSPVEWFAVTGVLAALLALATAATLGRRLATPLSRLAEAARRLERGERVAELDSGGDEDVATLSHAFASMASTVQKREEELRSERDLLDRVLTTLSAAVLVSDRGGEIELANPAAGRLLGQPPSMSNLRERFGEGLGAAVDRAAAGVSVTEIMRQARAPEGLWQASVIPLAGLEGRLLVVLEDLSEVARAERLASLAELARIVAHEIKNPLTPIRLWAEELAAALSRSPDEVVAIAQIASAQILERVAHLKEVAQGFSNLVAMEHWDPETVRLLEMARGVAGEYEVLAKRSVTISVQGDETAAVVADLRWLRRALRHLLENSVRALGEKGGWVTIGAISEGAETILTVRDNGGGVADEHLGRLFEPHFSTTSEGSGLGLAVVQRVVERAGGRSEASNVDGGLEVRLRFPRRLDSTAAGPVESGSESER